MDKRSIITEIQRTAVLNNGKPLGRQRFAKETGIRDSEWYGIHWSAWGDAVAEAGLRPNTINTGLQEEELINLYIDIMREVSAWPSEGKLKLICRQSEDLPSDTTFRARLGNKVELARRVLAFCQNRADLADIAAICEPIVHSQPDAIKKNETAEELDHGFVYLMKSGKYHKIGKSNSVGRREYELGTKLPEKLTTIHSIQTDDPGGVERYWHNRFADKRRKGEWFSLSSADVAAFKRWKRIY